MARKVLKYIVLVVVAANLALVMAVVLGGLKTKHHPLPNPNGYDDFVKAGRMLTGRLDDYKKMGKEELGDYVTKNKAALDLAHLGLSRGCRVPDNYSPDSLSQYASVLPSLKNLAFALCAEGRFSELAGNTNGAAEEYLNGERFGLESSRGGVIISKLVGIACEGPARNQLQSLIHGLDAGVCAEMARALEDIDGNEEPVEETLKHERAWALKATSIREKLDILTEYKTIQELNKSFIRKAHENTLRRRQLMIAFAARAYELKMRTPPPGVADLVPDYLQVDPERSPRREPTSITVAEWGFPRNQSSQTFSHPKSIPLKGLVTAQGKFPSRRDVRQ